MKMTYRMICSWGRDGIMDALMVFVLGITAIVAICVAYTVYVVRHGPTRPHDPREARERRLERQQERFYREQSFRFWRDLFRH